MKNQMLTMAMATAITVALTACTTTGAVTTNINDDAASKILSGPAVAGTVEDETDTDESRQENSDNDNMLTENDTEQAPDLTNAGTLTVESGKDITIDVGGTYILTGKADDASVIIDAPDDDEIQLVLDSLTMTNKDTPCIYVKNADKVSLTLKGSNDSLSVTGDFSSDGDTKTDAVIFSKDDLTISGTGSLTIASSDNGIACKDTLNVTGGNLNITCKGSALESKDEILISDGAVNITECNDGLHAEDNDDDTKGNICISGGDISINAGDDAIHATTEIQIDGGTFDLKCAEGIEGTVLRINDGDINIEASDDGINAAHKSSALTPLFEMNGGKVTIKMADGDTDGIDSNGDIIVNGGTIDITGRSTFDYDGKAEFNGGTIIENGTETNTITNQMMGGRGGMGGRGNMQNPEGMEMPEGMERPEGMKRPDGMERPEGMERQNGMGGRKQMTLPEDTGIQE